MGHTTKRKASVDSKQLDPIEQTSYYLERLTILLHVYSPDFENSAGLMSDSYNKLLLYLGR